ncbi:hypothetical protein MLD52_01645 [Puniceicoccaceae bacterium K14]|nr:hypothetical protein [Puniceicoccaceae bacterium K14]
MEETRQLEFSAVPKGCVANRENFLRYSRFHIGSWVEMASPSDECRGILFWDPRMFPVLEYGRLTERQMNWIRKNYLVIVCPFWHSLHHELFEYVPDPKVFSLLMTKDVQDEVEFSCLGVGRCLPYSYSDFVPDLNDLILETPKEFDFVSVNNPRPFKRIYEALEEIPAGSSILLLNWEENTLQNREFGPYARACLDVCKRRKHTFEFRRMLKAEEMYREYAKGKVALQLSIAEGNYRALTEVSKCGVPALYTPHIRGGGSRYTHQLRGKQGTGEPVYHLGDIASKSRELLDQYGDYKPRRILELTSRRLVFDLLREELYSIFEEGEERWNGEFREISAWEPGIGETYVDVRSIPEAESPERKIHN